MSDTKKRFIAGAVCPKCGEQDVLMMYRKEDVDHRECVECGFADEMRFQAASRELETRVNVTEEEKKSETQAVKILPPK
ncbi:MAG: YheV family putative metal-binding protein [Agarilytica sp.]